MNPRIESDNFILTCRNNRLDARPFRPHGAVVMGILNVTPDSFYDGGEHQAVEAALAHARDMVKEGAQIIDLGGESTRPAGSVYGEGAPQVSAREEKRRILPVLQSIVETFPDIFVSVDTYKPEVARDALEMGAHIINDITGLRYNPELAEVVAEYDAGLVVMHSVGQPGELTHETEFGDLIGEVKESLDRSLETARAAGVTDLMVDPGFGFGKRPEENLRLLAASGELLELGHPVLVGPSRKSTIGFLLSETEEPVPPEERLYGTLGATAVAVLRGASIVRTHDVRETREMLRGLGATVQSDHPSRVV